jgi:molybdopterin converting factor small subunit
VVVHLPTPLRPYAANRSTVDARGATVAEVMREVISQYPDLKSYIYSDDGNIRGFVNVYLNDEDIRYLAAKENSHVKDGDTLTIMPSIAGGR